MPCHGQCLLSVSGSGSASSSPFSLARLAVFRLQQKSSRIHGLNPTKYLFLIRNYWSCLFPTHWRFSLKQWTQYASCQLALATMTCETKKYQSRGFDLLLPADQAKQGKKWSSLLVAFTIQPYVFHKNSLNFISQRLSFGQPILTRPH
jgi:hypothetical protein